MNVLFELESEMCAPVPETSVFPDNLRRREPLRMPVISEREFVKHYTRLSRLNYSVDTNFYPLGSCTMKYNPKINEKVAAKINLTGLHPLQPDEDCQGILEILYQLDRYLCELTGMAGFSFHPAAGAQGELAGMLIFARYFKDRKADRTIILVPDTAHGTNPASAALAGFSLQTVASDERGNVDLADLQAKLSNRVAGLMITNPNTLGLFDEHICEIADLVHAAGGLLYYDGANFNAIMGYARPADMGFDVIHLNLHKSFATPHGGGGPGAGPCGVRDHLLPYLPGSRVIRENDKYISRNNSSSIGSLHAYHGPVGVLIRAFCYILSLGGAGLKRASQQAVANANYLRQRLSRYLPMAYDRAALHEFVLCGEELKTYGVKTLDVAKRLLDFGYYAPTIYFPLIVHEAMMFEPTETETRRTLDEFVETFGRIIEEVRQNPELVKTAPHQTPVKRVDDVQAARKPVINWYETLCQ